MDHNTLKDVIVSLIRGQGYTREQNVELVAKVIIDLTKDHSPAPAHIPTPKPVEVKKEIKVLARAGSFCRCHSCQKDVYRIVNTVEDPMKVVDFIDCFKPIDHSLKLTTETKFRNIEGNVSIDCPLCKQPFSCYLIGSPGRAVKEEGEADSVSEEDLGL